MKLWQKAQKDFDAHWARMGKGVCNIKFEDAADLFGKNDGLMVRTDAKPCDRLLVNLGHVSFCEIKSTENAHAFHFGMIRKGQINYAIKVTAAGGNYGFYVKSEAENQWFLIPWVLVANAKAKGRSSIKWKDLELNRIKIYGEDPK